MKNRAARSGGTVFLLGKFEFVGQGVHPCTPPKPFLQKLLAPLGANLPAAKFVRV